MTVLGPSVANANLNADKTDRADKDELKPIAYPSS